MNKKESKKLKTLFVEQLRKTPILQLCCEKLEVSRMTIYRWKQSDPEFAKAVDDALAEGKLVVNDLAESQLISAIRDRNITAILAWLRHHHPEYANKLELTAKIKQDDETLTPEQEALVRKGLAYGSFIPKDDPRNGTTP
jgi:hypothetical protein